jgi:Protein of unknown function (DUF3551)
MVDLTGATTAEGVCLAATTRPIEEGCMRALFLVVAIAAALSVNMSSSQATEGPWCAWVTIGEGDGSENCSLPSFEACRREITGGNRGSCYPNPHLGYRADRSRRSRY